MSRSFDFAVNAEKVVIKQKGKNKYKVKLAGVGDFLKYQTWSSTNANNINDDRSVSSVHVKDWVKNNFGSDLPGLPPTPGGLQVSPLFVDINLDGRSLNSNTFAPTFAPTAVMEVNNKKYIFVIENASYNNKKIYNTVFNVSTNQIVKNNVSKHLVKLPINKKLHKVRFDIDSSDTVSGSLVVNSSTSSYINNGNPSIFTPITLTFQYNPNNQNSIVINTFSASPSKLPGNSSNNGITAWNNFFSTLLLCSQPQSIQCPNPDSGLCILCTATAYYDNSENKKINTNIGEFGFTFEYIAQT